VRINHAINLNLSY